MSTDARAADFARTARDILLRSHAILEHDHFVYDSGQHGSGWIDKDVINEYTDREDGLCHMLAELLRDLNPEVVCGPATGGLIVSQWTAHALGVQSVFAEHDAARATPDPDGPVRGPFILRRGYDQVVHGKRVAVVDDVVNTGLSVRQTTDAVRAAGGQVVAAGVLVTRGNATGVDMGVADFRYLLEYRIPSWPAATCALCRAGVPVNTRYAHGAEYLARLQQASTSPTQPPTSAPTTSRSPTSPTDATDGHG
jgi:orotate phosphoribosyltransferase